MGDKIKVLMVGPDRSVHGGISGIVNGLYAAGLDEKVNLKYIGTMKEGSKLSKLFVAGIAYLRFLFCVNDCDIVHVNVASDTSFRRKSLFIKAAYRHGKRIVIHQHGGDFEGFYGKELDDAGREDVRRVFDMADSVFVLTEFWRQFFGKITDINKIQVFPNAIDVDESNRSKALAPKDTRKVLFMGRICKAKGISELISAIDDLHSKDDRVKLYLCGIFEDKEYMPLIEARKDHIECPGWVSGDRKQEILDECGIIVAPSYFEGFCVSLIEGMYNGLVAIGSRVGGIPDIITDQENGLLIEPQNTESLKKALESVMSDDIFAEKLKGCAFDKVISNYAVRSYIEKLVSVYEKL